LSKGAARDKAEGIGGKRIVVIGLSTEENEQQVLWPLTTENKKEIQH